MAEPELSFAGLLRRLRAEARLTQEELAEAAAVSVRAVSYLEAGVVTSPQKDTVRLRCIKIRCRAGIAPSACPAGPQRSPAVPVRAPG